MAVPCKKPRTELEELQLNGNKRKLDALLLPTLSFLPQLKGSLKAADKFPLVFLKVTRFSFCFEHHMHNIFSSGLTEVMEH